MSDKKITVVGGLRSGKETIAQLERDLNLACLVIHAQDALLTAYRLGRRPPDKALDTFLKPKVKQFLQRVREKGR